MHDLSAALRRCTKDQSINLPISALEGKYGEVSAFLASAPDGVEGLLNPDPFTVRVRTTVTFE
jgi:hypothetical protein